MANDDTKTGSGRNVRGLRLAIVGGGTGGHVVPGLHLLEHLFEAGGTTLEDLVWFETGRRAEIASLARLEHLVGDTPCARIRIRVEPTGGGAPSMRRLLVRTPGAMLRARTALKQHRPDVLFGLGGFTLLPTVLAAKSLGIPVALLEINAQPGRAVRTLTPLVKRVYHAWEASIPGSEDKRHLLTGPPLSSSLFTSGEPEAWRRKVGEGPLIVLLGGSQGAGVLNELVATSLDTWLAAGLTVVHQVGPGNMASGAASPRPGYLPLEFVDDVPGLLRAARLVVCRAGASTLAEVAALGVPALAVPYPGAGAHQADNARQLLGGIEVIANERLAAEGSAMVLDLASEAKSAWRAEARELLQKRVPARASSQILADLLELAGLSPARP
ncbi:MAG: UDP-N-acetylglucosamine--N-acetylmuramyl-(pentapeptide) pyrophosphoryl-undecaprenol N-acetylglucosamine transferase [Planctomycetota bacterium]|jgi:UDP-N-acetylglucosamine--N-acetylmuramyl-(pentapeptide) pyrophosphoryl-undecaprenol N-acetylglucosamine transferase